MSEKPEENEPDTPLTEGAFQNLARRIFSVTPEEMEKREAEYAAEQAKKGKRGPKPKKPSP